MERPTGFEVKGKHKVCLWKRSIYGPKQSSRQWNLKLYQAVIFVGLKRWNRTIICMPKEIRNFLCFFLYLLMTYLARKIGDVRNTKSWLFSKFDMNGIHEASYILGGRIIRDHKLLSLFQVKMFLRSLSVFLRHKTLQFKKGMS